MVAAVTLSALDSCGATMSTFAFEAIGTQWQIETPEPLGPELRQAIIERTERFDAIWSRFRSDSLVTRVAQAGHGGVFTFPDEAVALFGLYDRLHAATDGAVDPLVGRDLELLGYDADYSLQHDPLEIARYSQNRPRWRDVERNGTTIVTRRPLVIDIGAAGKGYLVDIVAGILRDSGIGAFNVDGSGDMVHAGPSPLRVGLEHPVFPMLAIGVAQLQDGALCASAANRRVWGPFHHVLDGRTGVPVRDVVATWVVADDAMTADGLATALFFVPAKRLAGDFDFSFVRMFADGRAEISPEFKGELFTEERIEP